MTAVLLKSAVLQNRASSKKGLLERLFAVWFQRLVYNQIWEDPVVDLEALRIGKQSRLLAISSGGCNILNYLLADPAEIVAVDLNPAHIALTRLKLAAVRHLPDHATFYRLFGSGADPEAYRIYRYHLQPHLDDDTRAFWEGRTPLGKRRLSYFAEGLYRHGMMGRFIGFLHMLARMTGGDPKRMLEATSIEEQVRLFEEWIAPAFDSRAIRALCGLPAMLYSLGIPPAQFDALRHDAEGDLARLYLERLRRLACEFPLEENYFAWQAFGRRYGVSAQGPMPDYLRERSFATLAERVGRVRTELASVTDFLGAEPPRSMDRYVLLDAQDWMSPGQLTQLWHEIDRTARPDARVIFRTAGRASPLEQALPPTLLANWRAEHELAATLFRRDRSAIYGGFHVYSRSG
ncbi:MAG TPA: BtaA family protein [Stellaceae bacterium]|nr:BtaA family protein [Stellaceae bacterium]